ncbi:unnamed protein product, partial [Protopolystoma xenopodis]
MSNPSSYKRNILIPIDASSHSKRAFNWYLEEMMRPDDLIHFIHIVEPQYSGMSYGIGVQMQMAVDELGKALQENVEIGKNLGQDYLTLVKSLGMHAKYVLHVGTRPGEHI